MEYLIGVILGAIVGVIARHVWATYQKSSAEKRAAELIVEGRRDADRLRQDALVKNKEDLLKQREQLDAEIKVERAELKQIEKRLTKREDNLDRKVDMLDKKELQIRSFEEKVENKDRNLQAREHEVTKMIEQQRARLNEISKMSVEEAKAEIIKRTEQEMEGEIVQLVERATNRAKESADEVAQKVVADSINRLAVDYTTEHVVSSVELPSDDMKGRIIGREGRNIRAFENATGVDVIVDDTPGVVVLSGFEPVRREIAARAMSRLVTDGRIHPARIEEVVIKIREEMDKVLEETGKQVALELDVRNLKPREIMLLGRLKFRTSYGQNVLDHSRDVGFLAGMIATQLGLDESLARRCGLLHDLGKAVDHEQEGTHPELGAEVARICSEPEEVITSILHHHTPGAADHLYATIVQAADAISAARPGARRETLENYVKRLERLENIATSYDSVDKAFAIQAGRELRVIADANKMGDAECQQTCRNIAKQIEDELTYPGEVKVTMVREMRITEFAR